MSTNGATREARQKRREDRFKGYPWGWFVVAWSSEVTAGEITRLSYFGGQQIAFRDESGTVKILDAYCPHLGAHLGGGKLVDGEIECPFHAWRFNTEGVCTAIPYADKIPRKARTRSWRVIEQNSMIFMWHHPKDEAPSYQPPDLPEPGTDGWIPWVESKVTIQTHPREIVENVVDKGHFGPVHGTWVDRFDNEFIDHKAIQYTEGKAYPRGGGVDNFKLTATYYGPGFQISDMKGFAHSMLVNAHTPISENSLDLRFGVSLRVEEGRDAHKMAGFAEAYAENLRIGFHEDIAIWEEKIFREIPVLCDGDGPIIKLRSWYAQFYQS
jgi:3-ketosteroid 9alpha-monooxygenase subunit A